MERDDAPDLLPPFHDRSSDRAECASKRLRLSTQIASKG